MSQLIGSESTYMKQLKLVQPLRHCSTSSTPPNSTEPTAPSISEDEWNLEYSGVVSSTIRTLKLVSIATATMSLIGSPLYIIATMDGQYTAVKVMAASGFTLFGLFTTGEPTSAACLDSLVHHSMLSQGCQFNTATYFGPRCSVSDFGLKLDSVDVAVGPLVPRPHSVTRKHKARQMDAFASAHRSFPINYVIQNKTLL